MEVSVSIKIKKRAYEKLRKDAKKEHRTLSGQLAVYQEFYHKNKTE